MKYVVTIARTYGSGGKEIGKLLAKELGIKYYGRETNCLNNSLKQFAKLPRKNRAL